MTMVPIRKLTHCSLKAMCACLAFTAVAANAAVNYVNLGTVAPPATLGSYTVQPFSSAAQAGITNGTSVTTIPGSPVGGSLTLDSAVVKATIGAGWSTWSHSYAGPVFTAVGATTRTLTLPPNVTAFYVYVEPSNFGLFNVQATTNSGATSGPVSVNGASGATGFGFYADPGETITSVSISAAAGAGGFAIGEFGAASNSVATSSIPTLSEWGMILMVLLMSVGATLVLKRRR